MLKIIRRVLAGAALTACALAAVLLFTPVPETVAPMRPGPDVRYWHMAGGYRIAYRRIAARPGAPARPPVIFLHGGPGGYVHSGIVKTLSALSQDGRDIYFYDQSGTGLSDRRARPKDTTIATHLRDLDAIRGQIGADKVVLIGHSFGGLLASLYAAEHPQHIDRLVLSSPGVLQPEQFDDTGRPRTESLYPVPAGLRFTPPQGYAEATSANRMPFRAMAAFGLAQAFDIKLTSDREMDAAINTLAAGFTRTMVCDPAHVRAEEGGAGGYSRVGTNFYPDDFRDPRPAMRKMTAPVLVLHGSCDFQTYGEVYEYAAVFPDAEYRYMPGAGHIIWWDRPDEYRAAIAAFLAQPAEAAP